MVRQVWLEVPITRRRPIFDAVALPSQTAAFEEEEDDADGASGPAGAAEAGTGSDGDDEGEADDGGAWQWWSSARCLCDHQPRLGVALVLTVDLPSEKQLDLWLGEPLRAVILPTSLFLTNRKGFPVLPKPHQRFVQRLFPVRAASRTAAAGTPLSPPHSNPCVHPQLNVQFTLRGNPLHKGERRHYLQYLAYLATQLPPKSEQDAFEGPYYDRLQVPLQPLADNLESQVYETFEKDPIKYSRYEEAIFRALRDRCDRGATVMVVRASAPAAFAATLAHPRCRRSGLGGVRWLAPRFARPTARRARCACLQLRRIPTPSSRACRLLAPIYICLMRWNWCRLRGRVKAEWGDRVTVVAGDMREWATDERADIMVSELLGSFSDNELSPECLDGAMEYLRGALAPPSRSMADTLLWCDTLPSSAGGVCIPRAYTSFAAPVMSSKLWNSAKAFGTKQHLETPYVVRMFNAARLASPLPCFSFEHPSGSKSPDNARCGPATLVAPSWGQFIPTHAFVHSPRPRFATLRFPMRKSALVHGFGGYFECDLFDGVGISINPPTASEGMFSWFPCYFPLQVRPLPPASLA